MLRSFLLAYATPQPLRDTQHKQCHAERAAERSNSGATRGVAMARTLALLLAALTVAADAARPRPVRALAVRGGS